MGLVRSIVRFAGRCVTSPRQTLASLPTAIESFRMRMRGDSTFRRAEDLVHASNCPARMIDTALATWKPASVLDVGCGTGKVIDYLIEKGIGDVMGLEGSSLAISNARHPEVIREADLAKPVDLGRRFDLVYSVEVAEHIRPEAAEEFVRTLTRHGDRVLMTAARPGQGGLGHLNEQEPAYWEEQFARVGFVPNADARDRLKALRDMYWENVMVFERK